MRTCLVLATLTASCAAFAEFGYSIDSNVSDHLYQIDLGSGIVTDLGALTFGDGEGLAFANNSLYALGGSVDQFWNVTTPPGTLVGAPGTRLGTDAGLDFHNGVMYNYNGSIGSAGLYTVNLATGLSTLVGSNSNYADGLAIDSAGNAFAADGVSNLLLSVNLSNGQTTTIGSLGVTLMAQTGLSFSSTGVLYMLTSTGKLFTVNTTTGSATFVADTRLVTGAPVTGFEGFAINAIPEPATLAVLGLAALALARRKR